MWRLLSQDSIPYDSVAAGTPSCQQALLAYVGKIFVYFFFPDKQRIAESILVRTQKYPANTHVLQHSERRSRDVWPCLVSRRIFLLDQGVPSIVFSSIHVLTLLSCVLVHCLSGPLKIPRRHVCEDGALILMVQATALYNTLKREDRAD